MTTPVKLACECGKVQGELTVNPKASFHVQCLCCDCQKFAAYLNKEDVILDKYGATELFQTYPTHVKITAGEEHIACIQLQEKGLYRWHTQCCNTPIGNTMTATKVPFIGIPVNFMAFSSEEEKQATLGPITIKAFGEYAIGEAKELPKDIHDKFPLSAMPKVLGFMVKGFITKKHIPAPFFSNGKPIKKATLID